MDITYALTKDGIEAFISDMYADTFNALDNGEDAEDPIITIGDKQLRLYACPSVLEGIEEMLNNFIAEQVC